MDQVSFAIKQYVAVVSVLNLENVAEQGVACHTLHKSVFGSKVLAVGSRLVLYLLRHLPQFD